MYVSLCTEINRSVELYKEREAFIGPEKPDPWTGSLDKARIRPARANTTMAHQELAAEIMAMRVAADEAEEKRIERKMVKLCFSSTVSVLDVGGPSVRDIGNMNQLFEAG